MSYTEIYKNSTNEIFSPKSCTGPVTG